MSVRPDQCAVVFDWNGTLLADTALAVAATNAAFARLGVSPVTVRRYQKEYEMPLNDLYLRLGCKQEQIDNNLTHIFADFGAHYEKNVHKVRLRRGAKNLLKAIKSDGHRAAILSNHTTEMIGTQTERFDIHHYFDALLANRADTIHTIMHKADKGSRLRDYVSRHDIRKAMVVGDSLEEIEIARSYGFVGVGLAGGFTCDTRLRAAKPDFMIRSLTEMPEIVRKVFGRRGV